jgi:hypothetical protein
VSLLVALSPVSQPSYYQKSTKDIELITTKMYLRVKIKGVNSLEKNLSNVLTTMISNNWRKCQLFGLELPMLWIVRRADNTERSDFQKGIAVEGCP